MGKGSTIFNLVFAAFPIVLGLLISIFLSFSSSQLLVIAILLSVGSLLLLAYAKLPKLQRGEYTSFGVGGASGQRKYYYASYVFLALAVSSWVALAVTALR